MAQDPDVDRLLRLVRLSLGSNVVLLLINGAMFYFLLVFVVNEPATVEGVSAAATSEQGATSSDPREEMRTFFKEKSQILDRAARRHGTNPADVVPTREEIDAAIESRTMRSAESELVLQKLKEGYDYYNLTWPVAVPNH